MQLLAYSVSKTDLASYEKTFAVVHGKVGLVASSLEMGGLH